jgi:hypothetical protein
VVPAENTSYYMKFILSDKKWRKGINRQTINLSNNMLHLAETETLSSFGGYINRSDQRGLATAQSILYKMSEILPPLYVY